MESLTIIKYMDYPYSHIKGKSVLNACWADMPFGMLGRTLNDHKPLNTDSDGEFYTSLGALRFFHLQLLIFLLICHPCVASS